MISKHVELQCRTIFQCRRDYGFHSRMVVLDTFPFREDSDVQYLGGLRRSVVSGVHHSRKETRFNPPETAVVESGIYLNTVYHSPGNEQGKQTGSQGYMEGVENSQGYMKCRLCHYETKIESLLRRHVIKHSLDSDFRCPACNFRENDPSNFVDHIGTHQSGKLVRCCFCPKKMTRAKLKSHVRIHRAVELYDCSMCQFSTNYEKTIKSHMDVYHTKEYSCHQCSSLMTKHELHWHMKFVHSMEPPEVAVPEPTAPVPAGRGTNAKPPKFSTKVNSSQSMLSRKFSSWKTSIAVKLQKHVAKKQFNCGKCDYKTAFKKLLRSHRAKHSLDNSLVCTKCGFKETGPGKFATHLALHSPNDLFECCFCGFQTPTRGTMSNHVSKHKPIPMFDCSECEFSAKRPASVRIHTTNVHVKRSRCTVCGVEVSRFAMLDHGKECHSGKVPHAGDGPSLSPNSEHCRDDPLTSGGMDSPNQQDENTVSCEFCNKPYAKSYVRKHAKKCQLESSPDLETRTSIDFKALPPEFQPTERSLAIDVIDPLNQNDIGGNREPEKSSDSSVLQNQSKSDNKPKKRHLRCNSCFFKTTKKRLLKKHVVKHLIDFRLTCPECGHKEMSSFRFARHVLQHGSDPDTFQCCFCSLSSPTSKRSYCAHLDLHRPVNIFDCPKCEYSSNRADNVRNHYKNNHLNNHRCLHCGEVMSKARLVKHLESHGEARDFNFEIGKAGEASEEALDDPQRIEQIESDSVVIGDQSSQCQNLEDETVATTDVTHTERNRPDADALFERDQDFFKCMKCTYKTKIQSLIDRHIAKHLEDVPFVCPLCGFEHINSRKFANHWDKHNCNANRKMYLCCFCDTEIKKKNCLKGFLPQHIEGHRAVALQDCPECEFSSHSRYGLDKHYKNQHVKKCECLLCGQVMTVFEHSYHTECEGTRADRSNESPRTDRQSIDFRMLRRRSAEVQESVIAALEDPALLIDKEPSSVLDVSSNVVEPASRPNRVTKQYKHCSSCDYKTPLKPLLKRHVLKHLIDVPFSCKICSFSSFDERTFADHIFAHSNSYKCHFCSYRAVNATAATRHFSSHKALAIHDCPKCEYTSKYKYRLVEHLKGKHVNVPRCSYCGRKMSKDELNSHERACGRSLRSKLFGQPMSSGEIPADGLNQDGTSSRVFAESYDQHVEAPSTQFSGLIDEMSSVEKGRPDDVTKGLLLHQLNLTPTQEHLNFVTKSSEIQPFGESYLAYDKVVAMTNEFIPSSEDAGVKRPVFRNSAAEISTIADRVQVFKKPDSAAVVLGQDAALNDSVSLASSTKMSSHTEYIYTPTVIQEVKSVSDQDLSLIPPLCQSSATETSTLADFLPAGVKESNSAAEVGSEFVSV